MRTLAMALTLACPSLAWGHELWLERAEGGFALRSGHRDGAPQAIPKSKVRTLQCFSQGAPRELLESASFSGQAVEVKAACEAVSASVDHGFACLTPDGEKPLPRSQCPDCVKAWRARQWAKWVDSRLPASARPVGDELEIVPVTDLAKARPGEKATFRVLLSGRPAAGATVAIGHKALGETDSAGEIRIRIRAEDFETVAASVRRPLRSPEAEQEVLEASLTFEVAR